MPDFERDGITLHFQSFGDAGTPAVVLLHAFTRDHRMWLPVVEALRDGFRVIAPDLRGHGLSSAPEDLSAYGVEAQADDVRGLLDHLGVELCALVGSGFGGMVALQLAVAWPERLAGLVVSDSSPAAESERYDDAFRDCARQLLEAEETVRRIGTAGLGRCAAANVHDPFLAEGVRRRYGAINPEGFLGTARAHRERQDLIPALGDRITCPVLLCVGDQDPAASGTRVMAEDLPGARVMTFKNTGHGVPSLRPDAFVETLRRFFRDLEEGQPTGGARTV
jgi:pimeloyl-ACP methyl ester carboxylesterase